jgi:hypothetical protein
MRPARRVTLLPPMPSVMSWQRRVSFLKTGQMALFGGEASLLVPFLVSPRRIQGARRPAPGDR